MDIAFDSDLPSSSQSSGSIVFDDEKPESDWSDLPKNIGPDAAQLGQSALNQGIRTAKGIYDLPSDVVDTGADILSGKSPMETPIGQDVKTVGKSVGNAVAGIPQSLENLGSKEEWIQHPVGNAVTAGGLLEGGIEGLGKEAPESAIEGAVSKEEPKGILGSIGESLKERGEAQATHLSDISGDTVRKMNPRVFSPEAQNRIRMAGSTPNVADIRNEIGNKLVSDNIVGGYGQDIGDRLQKINEKQNEAGKQVDKALSDIRKANRSTGEYEDVDDALHVQANPILKPILDTANDLRNSARSGLRQSSRFWRETYNSLAAKAEKNNGRLNFDDIRSELQDVGKDMNASVNSPRYATSKDIYAHLAEIKEGMVKDIASRLGNKDLANNLLNANKEYSFYSKIAQDTRDSAAAGEEPENMGNHMARGFKRGNIPEAVGFLGILKSINDLEPVMAQKLTRWGPGIQKYGGFLESAAKKGARNLAMADYVLKQQDPDYAEAMK